MGFDLSETVKTKNLFFQPTTSRIGFSILSLVGLSACRSPFLQSVDAEGAVIKGPLDNAFVFYDYNFNGIWDSNEPFTKTEADGSFVLNGRRGYSFTVRTDETTIDASSGEAIPDIMLKAPSGSGVVTPTTTIMEETGLDGASVNAILGLPADLDPTQFNPFSEDADPEMALAAEKVAHQVMTTVTAISSAVEGTGASSDDAFSLAIASVGDIVRQKGEAIADDPNADVTLDFTNTDDIETITNRAVERVEETGVGDADSFKEMASTLVEAVSNVNNEINNAEDLSSDDSKALFSLGSELNEQVKAAAEDPEANLEAITFSDAGAVSEARVEKATSLIEDLRDYSGSVIKGPLDKALVFLDYNEDGLLSPGEPKTRTIEDGSFAIRNARPDMSFTVVTDDLTTDTSSGQNLDNVTLTAPEGSSIISPITTLMVEADLNAYSISKVLGLPEGVDPTKFNPFADNVDNADAIFVEIISHQIMTTVTAVATALEGVGVAADTAYSIALEAFAEVVKVKSYNYFMTEFDDINRIIDLASEKADRQISEDLSKIDFDTDELANAIINVNAALSEALDLNSEESKELFSLSAQLNAEIQEFMAETESGSGSISFSDESVLSGAIDPNNLPVFQAGGRIHIDYKAFDLGSDLNEISFRFRDELGNSLNVYDYNQDGIATANINEQQMNGTYQLESISLRDNAYRSNSIELKADGTTQIWDSINNTWIYGEHRHKLSKLSFNVEGGQAPQTDFTPPDLISFNLDATEVLAGGRFNVSYEASDEVSGVREISFQFRNETGTSFSVYDYEQDGVATLNISENQMNGEYQLYSISLRDDAYRSNSIEYKADGTTQIWDGVNNTWIYGEHDFDFVEKVITVDGGVPPQTDFTPPELVSFALETDEVAAGKRFKIDYEANDEGSGLREISFQFER